MPRTVGAKAFNERIKRESIKLALELQSWAKAHHIMAERYPGKQTPSVSIIQKWVAELEPSQLEEFDRCKKDVTSRWGEIEMAALDLIEDALYAGQIKGQQLLNIAGIAADKRLRLMELSKDKSTNIMNIYNLVQSRRQELLKEAQDVIEGELLEDEPA